jgi:hypothetical protein
VALDVNLDANTIAPWREPRLVHQEDFDILGFMRSECCWLAYPMCAEFSLLWPTCPYLLRTGIEEYPQIATFEEACRDEWCRLGIPCPDVPPTASPANPNEPVGPTTQLRAYRYSWLNKYEQESNGSPPSVSYNVADGSPVVLQIPPCTPGPEYCVETILIYRSGTPFESGGETSNPQNTEWFLVAAVPCGTTVYTDSIKNINLSASGRHPATFMREETLPPPDDIHSIVNLENGMAAGLAGEWLVLSEPFAPHSWPLKLRIRLYDSPIQLAAVKNVLYVATNGRPYTIEIQQDCNTNGIQGVFRHREPMPIVSPRSMVAGSGVCFYASNDGLVALAGTQARVVSEQVWSRKQWQALRPNRIIGALLDNYYFGFSDIYGFRLRTSEVEHIDPAKNALTEISDRPQALWLSPQGYLYMAVGGDVLEWNTGDRLRKYRYQNTEFFFGRRSNIAAAYAEIETPGPLEMTLLTDRGDYTDNVLDSQVFRTPNWMRVEQLAFEVRGTAEIKELAAGSSYKEAFRAGANV